MSLQSQPEETEEFLLMSDVLGTGLNGGEQTKKVNTNRNNGKTLIRSLFRHTEYIYCNEGIVEISRRGVV